MRAGSGVLCVRAIFNRPVYRRHVTANHKLLVRGGDRAESHAATLSGLRNSLSTVLLNGTASFLRTVQARGSQCSESRFGVVRTLVSRCNMASILRNIGFYVGGALCDTGVLGSFLARRTGTRDGRRGLISIPTVPISGLGCRIAARGQPLRICTRVKIEWVLAPLREMQSLLDSLEVRPMSFSTVCTKGGGLAPLRDMRLFLRRRVQLQLRGRARGHCEGTGLPTRGDLSDFSFNFRHDIAGRHVLQLDSVA